VTRSTLKLKPATPKLVAKNAPPAKPRVTPAAKSPAPARTSSAERLSKRVMQLKACSRTEAEQYIEGGWVRVNGTVIEEPQHRVDQELVTVDGQAHLTELSPVTLLLNKPAGHSDGREEPTRRPSCTSARLLLTPEHHWGADPGSQRVLKRHFQQLEANVPLETGASGLVVFTQDWRTVRKLREDLATMEHEYLVDIEGEVGPDALKPIGHALKDTRQALPAVKVSVNSSSPSMSRLRFAVKGCHIGLIAYLCEAASLRIVAMKRTRLGRVSIADLPIGQWRYLAPWEKF
jgi:23S rRNA pseudouridine2604 synthase